MNRIRLALVVAGFCALSPIAPGFIDGAQAQDESYLFAAPTAPQDSEFVDTVSKMPVSMLDIGFMRLENRLWRSLGKPGGLSGAELVNASIYIDGNGRIGIEVIASDDETAPDDCSGAWHETREALSHWNKEHFSRTKNRGVCTHVASAFSSETGPNTALLVRDAKTDPCAVMKIAIRINRADHSTYQCHGDFYGEPAVRP